MNLAQRLSTFWQNLTGSTEMLIAVCVCVLVFSVLYFYLITFMLNNGANSLLTIFSLVMVISAVVIALIGNISGAFFLVVPVFFMLAVFVLYSVEIKRIIYSRRNMKLTDFKHNRTYDKEKIDATVSEIIKALQNMSKNDVGAIIVLSSGNIPSQIIDSGVKLDSNISSELIESVFFPKTPLHDGAMIISDNKIVAAGCFLPLSQNLTGLPKDLGSRHRAGIGVTETIDVTSLIVSEESGIISIARGGKITRYADYEMLKNTLHQYYWKELDWNRR